MAKTTLTVTFEGEAAERLLALAEASGRTPEWFADFMIREYAGEERAMVQSLKDGVAAIERGEGVPHEDVMREMTALIEAKATVQAPKKRRAAAR